MPKQNPQLNATPEVPDQPDATVKVEDMVADDKPKAPTKPVNVTKLPNGVVIEDY